MSKRELEKRQKIREIVHLWFQIYPKQNIYGKVLAKAIEKADNFIIIQKKFKVN